MKQQYEQPLHYLTQILLKQWDESSGKWNQQQQH
ncbi:hypothetical protein Goshw_003870 [Gossypium schwendimanii]|uniref:Uncharacterized protein n=1 Tax=Gossypium schwendimanii TaxID=34291 RepID=A0A7J9MFT5_GOSSC|nr:hypothetical protein [Gossypium schwendimanii]